MKATFKSMMVIGMMILGTATSFANTNSDKFNASHDKDKKECHIHHNHDANFGGHVVVDRTKARHGMDKKMHKHMMKGKHHFDKHGHCKKCHLTEHEIRRIEHDMHRPHHDGRGHHTVPPKPGKSHKFHGR